MNSGLERKLVLAVLLLFVVPAGAAGLVLVLLYRQETLADPFILAVALGAGGLGLMVYLATVAHGLGRSLVRTVREMQLGAELITGSNPEHRLTVRSRDELGALAEEINRLADRLGGAAAGQERAVGRATRALAGEKGALAAVLGALSDGVLAVSPDGRVALANAAAQRLLAGPGEPVLGRRLLDFVDAREGRTLLARLAGPGEVSAPAPLRDSRGRRIEARVSPLVGEDGRPRGVVLLLRGEDGPRPGPGVEGGGPGAAGEEGPPSPVAYDWSLLDGPGPGRDATGRARRLDALTYVVFDTETTGLHPERGDRIVSLAAVKVRDGVLRSGETFDALVNPGRPIPAASTRIHRITEAMVAGAPSIEVALPAFLRYAEDAVLVGHEVDFDLRFLERVARRLSRPALATTHVILDTLGLAEAVHGGLEEGHALEAVAGRLGVSVQGRHSALGDARIAAEVLVRLLPLLARRGVVTLGQLLDATGAGRA